MEIKILKEVIKDHIIDSLQKMDFNVSRTAKALQMNLRSLRLKLNGYGLDQKNRPKPKREYRPHVQKIVKDKVGVRCAWCNKKLWLNKESYDSRIKIGQKYFFCDPKEMELYKQLNKRGVMS